MTIKLVGSTNGSTSLDAPASTTGGADLSFTLPNATTGGIVRTTTTPGAILQVVSSHKSDTASTTSNSFTDTGLSVSITPSSTSNKILVLTDAKIGGSSGNLWHARLMRDSTAISIGDASGSRVRGLYEADGTGHTISVFTVGTAFLDSPSSTSSITYKLQYSSYSSNTVYLNRTGDDRDPNDVRTGSSITVMEIAG